MFGIDLGPWSVPAGAFLVETEGGEVCVDWRNTRRPPASGPVLVEFAALATEEDPGPAVVRFVERFGTLNVCREHGRGLSYFQSAWLYLAHIVLWSSQTPPVSVL